MYHQPYYPQFSKSISLKIRTCEKSLRYAQNIELRLPLETSLLDLPVEVSSVQLRVALCALGLMRLP